MRDVVVAIDGPAGAGKSSVSRTVARQLGYRYVDTGAMYRVVGVLAAEAGVALDDGAALASLCDRVRIRFEERDAALAVLVGDRDLSRDIRRAAAGQLASKVSAVPAVRERLVAMQRELAAGGGVVLEGRDIGTVVCPDAPVKIFLDASARERAQRRALELRQRGEPVDIEAMARDMEERDHRDRTRAHSPLRPAADAIMLDTTSQTLDQVVAHVVRLVRRAQTA